MKLELGKIKIRDIRFGDKSCVDDHVLSINKEEVERLVLEDDKCRDGETLSPGRICCRTGI